MAADFTPAEEVQFILMAPREKEEKVGRDFFREEWVEEPGTTMFTVGSAVVVVLMEAEEAAEDTLVEAVELM